MKKRTKKPSAAEERLNKLLGLTAKAEEVVSHSTGNFYGVTEDELQTFREAQGIIYFLQAPALFTPKVCKHCGANYLVSRMFVAFCSYTCIRKDLEARGFRWDKGADIETVIMDPQVYDGNEPIWIREPQLLRALEVLKNLLETPKPLDEPTPSTVPPPVSPVEPTSLTMEASETLSSPSTTITPSSSSTPGTTLSRRKRPSRSVTFGT